MRAIVTKQAVSEAAEALEANCKEPTIKDVQARIGGGSFTTVKRYLDQWKHERADAMANLPELPTEISSNAQEFARAVWGLATKDAQREVSQVKEAAKAQVDGLRSELADATNEIARLEQIEAEQAASIENQQSHIRETELKLVEAQTKAERVAELERSLAENLATLEQSRNELRDRAVDVGTLQGEVKALRNQVSELTTALKKS